MGSEEYLKLDKCTALILAGWLAVNIDFHSSDRFDDSIKHRMASMQLIYFSRNQMISLLKIEFF